VFAQLDMPNLLAGIASHLAGVSRVVLSFRNYNPSNFPYLYCEWLLPAYQFLSKSDRVFFSGNSRGANTDYATWIGIPIDRVAYIPNAIDPDIIPTPTEKELVQARATLGIASDTPVILGVMRLQAEKDPATFVEVCARIAKEFPNMRALIAGIGPMQGVLEAQIASLGLGSQLFLLGRRSDVNVLMSLATLLLLPSQKEGMPNVVLEAQLMGTPIVATRAGATSDAVLDGETAILRPIGDVEGLARACIDLIGNPTRARAMGQAGQRFVRENFRKEKFGQCYLNLVQGEPYTATATEIGNPPMHASSVLP
jgi:glycosyltransferase involved in cell wall biosynthesis